MVVRVPGFGPVFGGEGACEAGAMSRSISDISERCDRGLPLCELSPSMNAIGMPCMRGEDPYEKCSMARDARTRAR